MGSLTLNRSKLKSHLREGIMRHKVSRAGIRLFVAFAILSSVFAPYSRSLEAQETAKRIEVDEANFLLKGFERYIRGLEGKEGELTPDAKRALTKIGGLRKEHPTDERVKDLFQRAQAAVRGLKGDRIKITPEMLSYRDLEKRKADLFTQLNQNAWSDYQKQLLVNAPESLTQPFPMPNPEKVSLQEMRGRVVFLEGLRYPDDMFLHYGQQYIAIGSASTGVYFVNASNQSFVGAYEAVRRYQRSVSDKIPSEWTVVGKIVDTRFMPLGGGNAKNSSAVFGWEVEVEKIYVKDHVFASADAAAPNGGSFVGEAQMQSELENLYTIKQLPEEYSPEKLLDVFVTAIKEKNYELYLSCIHPDEKRTLVQKNWLQRKWDIFQRRFSRDIVEVQINTKDEIRIIQGGASNEDKSLLGQFVDSDEVDDITNDGLPRSELLTLWLKLYDETGRIREYKKPLTLKRDEKVKGFRWFVYSGYPF